MQTVLPHALNVPKSRDDRARERSVSSLRAYILNTMANDMRADYDKAFSGADHKDGVAVHKAMRERDAFKLYSSMRCAAQEMVWNSVIDSINAGAGALNDQIAGSSGPATVELDDSVSVPDYYRAVDVHLMPGNYDGASEESGGLAGAVYDNGFNVFAFGAMGKEHNDIGWSMANFVRLKFPEVKPGKVVDVGCTIGHNTLPWKQTFPEATVFGVDLAEPCLRYAKARADSLGIEAHFRQGGADKLDFEDASVDVVFSSMFLHELPRQYIDGFLAEAHRVLKPGGVMIHMELPPNGALEAYDAFYLDWDSYYNNEPFYKNFRDQDYAGLCSMAGFPDDAFFQAVMPRYTYVDEADFRAAVLGEAHFDKDTGRLSDDIQWYGFGSVKAADRG